MWKFVSCVLILVVSLVGSVQLEKDTDQLDILEDFPCNGTTKILEIFDKKNPSYYTVVIIPAKFFYLPARTDIKLKFDSLANVTLNFEWLSLYDDSLSLHAVTLNRLRENLTLTVQPREGKPYPNLISAKINMEEVCSNGVHMGVWDKFLQVVPSLPDNVFEEHNKTRKVSIQKPPVKVCGKRTMSHQELITAGDSARVGDWPWHAAIYRLRTSSAELKYICGGTLISRTRVLTAGHCVIENGAILLAERLLVSLGKLNYLGGDPGLQERTVHEIVLHPEFIKLILKNDIAILKLSTEVEFTQSVHPICLPKECYASRADLTGKYGYVVGWGATRSAKYSAQLKQAVMPVKSDLDCVKTNPSFYAKFLSNSSFCAGFANGTAACNGDSGGGFYLSCEGYSGNSWQLRGIVSLGVSKRDQPSCDPDFYTIFTDIAQYLDFIYNNVEDKKD